MKHQNSNLNSNESNSARLFRNKNHAADHYISIYDDYLEIQKGLSTLYRRHLCSIARLFLQACFGSNPIIFKSIQSTDIRHFFYQYASHVSPSSAQAVASDLRSFLRFLRFKNLIIRDFSGAVPSVAKWKGDRVPAYLSDQEVTNLLNHCDKSTSIGLRNYTIIVLLLGLGLRASEAAGLKLDDIDWVNGEITIRGKGSTKSRLPLTQDLGDDLVFYLRNGRPSCSSRFFFVGTKLPYTGIKSACITSIVAKAFECAGIKKKGKAHLLRHTFATKLLSKGASLQEIGSLLGHKSIDTTSIYAKVDFNRLRSLALPWPENLTFGGAT